MRRLFFSNAPIPVIHSGCNESVPSDLCIFLLTRAPVGRRILPSIFRNHPGLFSCNRFGNLEKSRGDGFQVAGKITEWITFDHVSTIAPLSVYVLLL